MISHVKAVFSLTGLAPTPKFVLIALADMADSKDQCWPSVARLCQMTSFTERTVQAAVLQLCKSGHVKRQSGNGRTHTTVYTLTVKGALTAPLSTEQNPADDAPILAPNGALNAGLTNNGKGAANAGKGAFAALKGAANTLKGAGDAPEENRSTKEENRSTSTKLEPPPTKSKKKQGRRTEPVFPNDLPEEYRVPLRLWWQHKRERNQCYKPTGWEILIREQRLKPLADLIRDVEFSASQNYQGIFPPRGSEKSAQSNKPKDFSDWQSTDWITGHKGENI